MMEGYCMYFGFCSYEYFYMWNVKCIKLVVFVLYDFICENYMLLLWLFEGFMLYYDDLMLVCSGLML